MLNFEQFLHEKSLRDQAIEDFGRFLFGDFLNSGEEDTHIESVIFDALVDYMKHPNMGTKANLSEFLKILDKYKKFWPNILVPKERTVYRGTQLSLDDMVNIVKRGVKREGSGHVSANYTYKSRTKSPLQSWTTEFEIAEGFAHSEDGYSGSMSTGLVVPMQKATTKQVMAMRIKSLDGNLDKIKKNVRVAAVLEAKVNDDMIFTAKFMNNMATSFLKYPEHEIIRTTNKPIRCKIIIHNELYEVIQETFL